MLISPAYAQTGGGGGDLMVQLLPLVLIFVVFWFFLIRPQQQKMKQHRELVANLKRGDQVVTSGGLIGRISKVLDDSTVQVDIADNVRVKVLRSSVTDVLSRGEPVKGDGGKSGEKDHEDRSVAAEGAPKPAERKSLFSFGPKR